MCSLQGMGFEKGWGDTAQRVSEMVHLLLEILQAPDPSTLETFLGRIPMVFNVVIVSPHGYFGQANVLGLPDTGGQVVYLFTHYAVLLTLYDCRKCKSLFVLHYFAFQAASPCLQVWIFYSITANN